MLYNMDRLALLPKETHVCIYLCVYIYIYMYVCIYTCIYVYECISELENLYIPFCVSLFMYFENTDRLALVPK
jgi:hypothetical protein